MLAHDGGEVGPARLSTPIARLRRQAMTCGVPVRTCEAAQAGVQSRGSSR